MKYAFEGKFTAKWRAENADKLETADELYKKVKLGNVAETCLGKMLDKKKNKGEYEPYLRNINVRWGEFDLSDLLEMRFEEREQERFSLQKGDLVVCEGGEPGRAAIWSGQVDNMKIQKALHRVRLNKDVLNSYLLYYLMYSAMSGQLGKYFTGTTIKHLTGTKLKQFEFPLPFIDEQSQIVQEIESRLSVCDKIEQSIKDGLAQAKALKQSILKKAFEGKLVPQDPNDEPAEKLLERIINIKVNS